MTIPSTRRASKRTANKTAPKPLTIKHWMTPAPHSIGRDQPLVVAHALMRAHKLRHLPVLEHGKLVGILSERDLLSIESTQGVNSETEQVEEAMSQNVYWVTVDAPLKDVVFEMAEHRYGCAVVLDKATVVGIFTTVDALDLLAEKLRSE